MKEKTRKWFKIYGIFRIVWGFVLISGVFVVFWTAWRASEGKSLGEENLFSVLWLVLTVLMSAFHIITGAGIHRFQKWIRSWLLVGWPVVLCGYGTLAFLQYQQWAEQGLSVEPWTFLHSLKLLGLGCLVLFDLVYLRRSAKGWNGI